MDSDSDSNIFLTQNSFRSEEIENVEDIFNLDQLFPEERRYEPIVSDISDEEMIAASLAVEEGEKVRKAENKPPPSTSRAPNRFAEPVNDNEMTNITRRR